MDSVSKYQTFGIAYEIEEDAMAAEFAIFAQIKQYIKTHRKADGTFVKTLSAEFPEVKVEDANLSKIIMPDNGLVS